MFIKIIFMAMVLCPTVTGQTEEFEQECNVLQTLDTLGARLQRQESLLEERKTRMEHQDTILAEQATLLEDQKTRLQEQEAEIATLRQNTSELTRGRTSSTYVRLGRTTCPGKGSELVYSATSGPQELARGRTSSTYVRWGRTTCPGNGSKLVYSGYVGGSWYGHPGAAVDHLCLPTDPRFAFYEAEVQGGAFIYGAEYVYNKNEMKFFPDKDPDVSLHNKEVPCTVCQTPRSTVLMVPARTTCHDGWTLEYAGYLSAGHYNHPAATQYVCLDGKPEYLDGGGTSNEDGVLLHLVEARCGSLKCPPYEEGWELTCAVCSL